MATGRIDRKDWGMSWNKALDSGGVLVSDSVRLEINAELAERQAPPAAATGEKPAAPVKPAAPAANPGK
jgi:hypothetical protein